MLIVSLCDSPFNAHCSVYHYSTFAFSTSPNDQLLFRLYVEPNEPTTLLIKIINVFCPCGIRFKVQRVFDRG
jgi:hypothetical protein